MKTPNSKPLPLFVTGAAVAVLVLIVVIVLRTYCAGWSWASEPVHSTVEAVGAVIAFLMAFLLVQPFERDAWNKTGVAFGFMALGTADALHALAHPGQAFVFLRGVAGLTGALGFALTWVLPCEKSVHHQRLAGLGLVVFVFGLGVWALGFEQTLPHMVEDGSFTPLAIGINVLSGLLFLVAACCFVMLSRQTDARELPAFAFVAVLFGIGGLTFAESQLWSATWWFWHLLRLAAYVIVLRLVAQSYLRVEEERRESDRRFRLLVDGVKDYAIVQLDPDGHVLTWNSGAERLKSYRAEEIVGQHFTTFYPEEDVATGKPQRELQVASTEGRYETEGWRVRKDGSRFWATALITALHDKAEEIRGFAMVTRDISERKRWEDEQCKFMDALKQSNDELQQFAYVASHDLQEPLRAISGFVQLLQNAYKGKLDEQADMWIGRTIDGVKRMQTLIRDLLTFSRIDSRAQPFKPITLREAFDDAVEILTPSIIDLDAQVTCDELPTVAGDPSQMVQLLQNLIGNGIKYHDHQSPCVHLSAEKNGREWVIAVRDNGIGIDPKHHERIFEIFHRLHTKREYPGTGIGLAVCRRIVQRHGGRIWVDSGRGAGTTFYFTVPERST